MSESTRRRKYRYDRVLIEAARILDPQFADAVVFLSGAQIEMLRNVTQYLNRLETYVTEYNPGYYLAPTVEDYDSILAIVADLEEVLMGNPNTIWGYLDVYRHTQLSTTMPAGESTLYGGTVPAGEVWRVLNESIEVDSATCTSVLLRGVIDGQYIILAEIVSPVTEQFYPFRIDVILKEGDRILCTFYDMTLNDDALVNWFGYKMAVP